MKRSPLRRKTELARKEFRRKPAPRRQEAALPASRKAPKGKGRKQKERAKALREGPSAAEFRDAVWLADGGRCVACGREVPRFSGPWEWQCHHALPKQGLPDALRRDADGAVLLHRRCHERHTSRTATVPLERLPWRVLSFAARLGPAAEDRLIREHPGGGEQPRNEGGA